MSDNPMAQQLLSQLQGAPMQQIAQQLGTNTEQASSAVSQALPVLMNALGNQSQGGLASILGSLAGGSGGAGGLAGMLGGLLGGGQQASGNQGGQAAGGLGDLLGSVLGGGAGQPQAQPTSAPSQAQENPLGGAPAAGTDQVLDSVLGQQQGNATTELSKSTGLSSDTTRKLLATLVPIVIAFLGQRYMANRNTGSAESTAAPSNTGAAQSSGNSLNDMARNSGASLGSLLDQNGDGKLDMNDVVKLGSSLFGKR